MRNTSDSKAYLFQKNLECQFI